MEISQKKFLTWLQEPHLGLANKPEERLIELYCKEVLGAAEARTDGISIMVRKKGRTNWYRVELPDWYQPFYKLVGNYDVHWHTARRFFNVDY